MSTLLLLLLLLLLSLLLLLLLLLLLQTGRSRDRFRLVERFSATVKPVPGTHPGSCKMDDGSFPGVQRSGRGVKHITSHSTEVKRKVDLYLSSPSVPS